LLNSKKHFELHELHSLIKLIIFRIILQYPLVVSVTKWGVYIWKSVGKHEILTNFG